MPSLVPGYEYDVFISYRQNDNRSGWVTEFVSHLNEELAATIKETVSVYFDSNPHDGLLETHDVDKSLEGKLKCLIFVPIISQTYCDSKSFAWQSEFCVFNKLVKEDQFGRDIRLTNGNVTSRILPIKIHDLYADDKAVIENEIGGALRAIEYIYKEPGVNRPLKPTDIKSENQHKTDYQNQINKTANAIKEIIHSVVTQKQSLHPNSSITTTPAGKKSPKVTFALSAFLILTMVSLCFYFFKSETERPKSNLDRSIAVLAFVDMSPTHDQEYLGDGISEEIINVLAQTQGLKVIARSSSFQFKGKNEDLRTIGKMLGVATVLEGSFVKVNDRIKVTAQLINAADGTHLWSKRFDQDASNIFVIHDEIARGVSEAFKTTLQAETTSESKPKWNDEAYKLYQQGVYFHNRGMKGDLEKAKECFSRSIQLDSSHAIVWALLSNYYKYSPDKQRLRYINKAINLDSSLAEAILQRALFHIQHLEFKKADLDLKKAINSKPTSPRALRNIGVLSSELGYYELAVQNAQKAVEIDPLQPNSQYQLGSVYLTKGNLENAIKALTEFTKLSDVESYADYLFIAYSLNGDSINARKLLPHFRSHDGADSLFFKFILAQCTGKPGKANTYFQQWIKSAPTSNFQIAEAYAFKQDRVPMFKFLEKAVVSRDPRLSGLLRSPAFISYRNDSEFMAIKRKLNFP